MPELNMKERYMLEAIEQVIDGTLGREAAAERLGVTTRTIRRKVSQYLHEGEESFAHKSRGRDSRCKYSMHMKKTVLELYSEKYHGYNFTHFHQKLIEVEKIAITRTGVYRILSGADLVSPKAHTKRKGDRLHPTRERRAAIGELLQMDASKHGWFSKDYAYLHAAIDDATGTVTGAHFGREETLDGYYRVHGADLA
jgi:transposase